MKCSRCESESWAIGLCRTLSDFRGRKCRESDNPKEGLGEEALRRSKRELGGESPKFLVRTGSLKTRSMLEREEKREGGSTCYMLQSGCYLWTGRWFSILCNSYEAL